ncbi:MAG: hypothetical protein ABR880_02520 [Candidatus Sulfotelmatobacter sp.]
MESWKKAVVAASVGAATVLFVKKRYPAGVLAGGVALAMLAAEYPEKFENVRKQLPDYFDRGMQVMEMAARAGKRITEAAGQSAMDVWEEP